MTTTTGMVEAWRVAGRELGIEVVAPFRFEVEGRSHECVAWLAHFGREKGLVLVELSPPDFATEQALRADAKRAGYQWSALDLQAYASFDRNTFVEALVDWGFTGPLDRRPSWLDDDVVAIEARFRQGAEYATQQLAVKEGLRVQHTLLGQDVTLLPTGERVISVRVTLQDGAQRCFEYRCDARGVGKIWSVECH